MTDALMFTANHFELMPYYVFFLNTFEQHYHTNSLISGFLAVVIYFFAFNYVHRNMYCMPNKTMKTLNIMNANMKKSIHARKKANKVKKGEAGYCDLNSSYECHENTSNPVHIIVFIKCKK